MASHVYPKGGQKILSGAINFPSDTIKTLWYAGSYNSGHEFVGDLTGGSIVVRTAALAGKTVTGGVFDANDVSVSGAPATPFGFVILYKDTGVDATSPLIAAFDIGSYTPTGSDNEVFNASGIYSVVV